MTFTETVAVAVLMTLASLMALGLISLFIHAAQDGCTKDEQ